VSLYEKEKIDSVGVHHAWGFSDHPEVTLPPFASDGDACFFHLLIPIDTVIVVKPPGIHYITLMPLDDKVVVRKSRVFHQWYYTLAYTDPQAFMFKLDTEVEWLLSIAVYRFSRSMRIEGMPSSYIPAKEL